MRIAIALLLVAACSKSDDKSNPMAKAVGATLGGRDAIVEAWKDAKLSPSALTPAQVAFGKDCQSGTVENLDVMLCDYPSPAEAKAAEDQGLTWIGEATGASQAHGPTLVLIADRRKADPSGRTINRMLKLAPK
jgi:hypothetical protein